VETVEFSCFCFHRKRTASASTSLRATKMSN